jgi:hypothetical protein
MLTAITSTKGFSGFFRLTGSSTKNEMLPLPREYFFGGM